MRTLKNVFVLMFLFMMGSFLLTCKKEDDKTVTTDNEVTFSFKTSDLKSTSILKSSLDYDLADADKIVLTIQNSDGSPTKYTSYEVDIQQMTGIYQTQKIILKTGIYKLTEFLIINAADSTIFVAPLTGSQEAQNVNYPLPVTFSVAKDIITIIPIEVVSTKNKIPENFGLIRFPILEVKSFNLKIGVIDRETGKVLSAKGVIYSGAYINEKSLDSVLTNIITVKDGFSKYTLIIEKNGYETYVHTYTSDSLKKFKFMDENFPLLVELGKDNESITLDYDGNIYHSLTIGTQIWMAENLKSTRYNDYTPIPLQKDAISWERKTPGYVWYDNNENKYKDPYGALYKWYTINTGKLCPIGWHVPSEVEWELMINYLGGADIAGGKLKEAGIAHWKYGNNIGSTNESGFTALPAGYGRVTYFGSLFFECFFWTSTESIGDPINNSYYYVMSSSSTKIEKNTHHFSKNFGISVRCMKD